MNQKPGQRVKVEFTENLYLNLNLPKKHNEILNFGNKSLRDITAIMLSNRNVSTEQDFYVCVDKNINTDIKENVVFNDHCYLKAMKEEDTLDIKEEDIKEEINTMEEEHTGSRKDNIYKKRIIKCDKFHAIRVPNTNYLIIPKEYASSSIKEEDLKDTLFDENSMSFKNDDDDMIGDEGEQMIGDDEKYDNSQDGEMETTYEYVLSDIDDMEVMTIENEEQQDVEIEPFSKESLQTKLQTILESRGDIKTADGTLIEKDLIMKSFNGMLDTNTMKNLWASINGIKKKLCPDFVKILQTIQNKYKKDLECAEVFDIEYLYTDEKMFAEFDQRKTYNCYLYADYRCEICYQGFKHEKQLDNHYLKGHHESAGEIVCLICSLRYKKKSELTKHISVAHRAVYKCKRCSLITYYRSTMINHCDQHQGKQYNCDFCGLTYKSRSTLNSHVASLHRLEHTCLVCGQIFTGEKALKYHRNKEHPQEPTISNYACPPCSVEFLTEAAYLEHSMLKHDGLLHDGTELTRFNYKEQKKVKSPKEKRLMKKPQVCRVCNEWGTKNGWLNRHFLTEHPTMDIHEVYADTKEYLCHICPKGFKLPCMLRDHLNTHTGLRPYACDHCPKRFHSRSAATCHRQWHMPPTHECSVCKKMFHTGTNLSNHMRTHIGDRRYKCKICNKGFLHSGSLNEHVRGVHQHVRRIKKRKKPIAEEKKQKKTFREEEEEEEDYSSDDGTAEYLDLSMI